MWVITIKNFCHFWMLRVGCMPPWMYALDVCPLGCMPLVSISLTPPPPSSALAEPPPAAERWLLPQMEVLAKWVLLTNKNSPV